jgi:hypothetical protein
MMEEENVATSQRKIAANQANGKKGGVKSVEGKLRSCQNARKHDLFSKSLVIRTALFEECEQEYRDRLRQLEIDYPGEEVEQIQSRIDLVWVDLETGRIRDYYRLLREQKLRDAQSGLAKQLFDAEEQLKNSKNRLQGYHNFMKKLESWRPDFSPEQIPKEDLEAVLKSARDVYDRYQTGKMTTDNTMKDVLEVSALMPEPTLANYGDTCRILLTLYQLTVGIVETAVDEQQLEYDRLVIRIDELPMILVLPESEQKRMYEYEAFLQQQRDRILIRIESIIDRRSHRARMQLPAPFSSEVSASSKRAEPEIDPKDGGQSKRKNEPTADSSNS